MFDSLTSRFSGAFASLRSRGKISSSDIETTCVEIRQALLESDVALSVVDAFIAEIRQKSLEALPTLQSGTNQANAIFEIVNASLVEILAQLQVVGESVNVPVFAPEPGNGRGDPVQVAKAGIEFAKSKQHNMVIVDTAGRLGVDQELMKQASDIRDAVNPDEILFVVDAMMGQDAVRTSQAFLDGVGFDGVVLTKLDGDARGGAALSIASLTKRPIMFASTGEKLHEFDIFYPERMASRILGLGDVATLAEQAKKAFDTDTSAKLEAKFASGEDFTLEDFLEQLQAMSKMGNMSKLLGMLPGAGAMKKQIGNFDEGEIVRTKAIVQSMTPKERQDPKVLNGSRRARIALGSGRKVSDVNNLVDRFSAAQKMMKQVRNGAMPPGMPPNMGMGMGPLPALPKANKPINKKKSKSGNPAKRALEEGL